MATNNPLTIWVDYTWESHASVEELRRAGHTVTSYPPEQLPNLILSTRAWNWSDSMWPFLEVALKSARKDKPKGVKKDGKQRKSINRTDRNGTGKVSRRGRKAKLPSSSSPNELQRNEA